MNRKIYNLLAACLSISFALQLTSKEDIISVQAIKSITPNNLTALMPINRVEIVLTSKNPTPLYITAYGDPHGKKGRILSGQGVTNNIITLKPNETIKITSKEDFYLHAGTNKASMEHPDLAQINSQIKDSRNDRNWLYPSKGSAYILYYNNKGLVPGLLHGAGYSANRTPTSWGKICGLELINQAEYQKNNSNATNKASQIMATLDSVMNFQKSRTTHP